MSDQTAELEVTPEQTEKALAEDGASIIDVREDHEVEAGRIPGSRHIGLQSLPSSAAEIDQSRPVIFSCRTGSRSLMAAQAFRQAGYEAYSMAGGLVRWHQEGRPIDPEDGHVADQ